ncbi:MAG: cation:proton antiporter [Myxococcota bacterium]
MGLVSLFLLAIAAIFLIGIVGELVFERTGVPDVVWLIVVGIILGPVTGFVEREQLAVIAPYFGALTLVVVLFDGGSKLNLSELRHAAARCTVMALLSFALSVAVLAVASMAASWAGILPPSWTWLHALVLGSILGGSSSVVIMPALRKAGLAPHISNLVNLESALTDVLCVVSTVVCINIYVSGQTDIGGAGLTLVKSFGIGLGIGAVAGLLSILVLRRLRKSAYAYPLTLGALLVIYVLIDELGGSAALGILATAIMVGNAPTLSKAMGLEKTARLGSGVTTTHDQIVFIIKSFFFCFIGEMLGPPWVMLFFGVLLGVLLLFARLPAVAIGTFRSGLSNPAKGLVAVSMPRGMAAGVLAIMPAQAGMSGTEDLPVVVFASVFTTILIFAVGFPVLKAQLKKHDPDSLVPIVENSPASLSMDSLASAEGQSRPPGSSPASSPPASSPPASPPSASSPPPQEVADKPAPVEAAPTLDQRKPAPIPERPPPQDEFIQLADQPADATLVDDRMAADATGADEAIPLVSKEE